MAAVGDLTTDRRVLRHSAALRDAGCRVTVLGRNDLNVRHQRGWLFYAEYNHRLWRRLISERPDVVWANDVDTLPGAWLGSRRRNAALVLDAHELFSEVPEIQHKPFVRWVWRTVERTLMHRCNALMTVCQSIADYYHGRYGVKMEVVRNVPEVGSEKWKVESEAGASQLSTFNFQLSTLLYQGSVNLGRGVDWAIDALEWLPDCQLVVAGGGDLLEAMRDYAEGKEWADRVTFLGRMTPDALMQLTPTADVGLVMLEDMGLSYHYALPNRIGDFVAAGVPIVVSDLPEMAAVVRRYPIGEIIEAPGAKSLACAIRRVLDKGIDAYDFAAARKDMDWTNEKKKLIGCLEKAIVKVES